MTMPLAFCMTGSAGRSRAAVRPMRRPTSWRRARYRVMARAVVRESINNSSETREGENGSVHAACST